MIPAGKKALSHVTFPSGLISACLSIVFIAVSGWLYPEALHSSRPDPREGRPGTKHNRAYLS